MSNTLEPNFNGLPKPTDWKKVIVPLQQANEKEFRGATLLELGDNLNIEMSINAQRVPAVPPGALVAGPADREVFMEIKVPGSWTWGANPPLTNAQGNISTFYWDKTDWKKNDSAALPKGENGDPGKDGIDAVVVDGFQSLETHEAGSAKNDKVLKDLVDSYLGSITSNSTHYITDSEGRIIAEINNKGELDFYPTAQTKNRLNIIQDVEISSLLYAFTDSEGKILFGVDNEGNLIGINQSESESSSFDAITNQLPYDAKNGKLDITELVSIKTFLSFPSVAKGRASTLTSTDWPLVPLTTGGYTHPSVVFVPSGWNGYRFWLAITPTFGIISQQPDPAAYENPHVFCSQDGITWIEPLGINNPLDLSAPTITDTGGYWSDTHLVLGDDGYMHLFYRGSYMPDELIASNASGGNVRSIVHRKSRDGVNWGEKKMIYSNSTDVSNRTDIGLMSPAFIQNGAFWNVYDLCDGDKPTFPLTGENQTQRVVIRRVGDVNMNFERYSQQGVVNFKNRPWGITKDVWHLDAHKVGNTYFLLLCIGVVGASFASELWLAYSGDGWNFDVCESPISLDRSYRSCIVPFSENGEFQFYLFNNHTNDGSTDLQKFKLKYL